MEQKIRTYSELMKLTSYEERLNYLKLDAKVAEETFGFERYLNQTFYKSPEWRKIRNEVILRDKGMDMGLDGYDIYSKVFIHHMNPINPKSIVDRDPDILNPEYLISVSFGTHQAIHYGFDDKVTNNMANRKPNDTSPWR